MNDLSPMQDLIELRKLQTERFKIKVIGCLVISFLLVLILAGLVWLILFLIGASGILQ